MFRLPVYSRPAHKATVMPETKLGGEKEPTKNPMIPPKVVDNMPKYGPRIMPIIGAVIAAAVMALPGNPIIGEIGRKPKTTYKAVKQTVKAMSFVLSFLLTDILQSSSTVGEFVYLEFMTAVQF